MEKLDTEVACDWLEILPWCHGARFRAQKVSFFADEEREKPAGGMTMPTAQTTAGTRWIGARRFINAGLAGKFLWTTDELLNILNALWAREMSVDDAWRLIDRDREIPSEYGKQFWLPLESTDDIP